MFSSYKDRARSMFTYVTSSGVTFSVLGDGTLFGGASALGRRMAMAIVEGELLVTTPHRAGGAFRERGPGGVYGELNAKARLMTLQDWVTVDPRATVEDGCEAWTAIEAKYGQFISN